MTPKQLMFRIEKLSPTGPVTDLLTKVLYSRKMRPKKAWYRHQKEHWLAWLSEYDGSGAYGRTVHEVRTAEFIYNHMMCPPMVLWLGEGVGLPRALVERAAEACLRAGPTLLKQCAAIRSLVSWQMIEERLRARYAEKPLRLMVPKADLQKEYKPAVIVTYHGMKRAI
jgi:hypothetical protein